MEEQTVKTVAGDVPFLFASARHRNVECVRHMHATMEIIIVTDGMLEMTVGDRIYSVPKRCGVFVPPFVPHSFHSPQSNDCHVLMFSRELVSYFFELLKSHEPNSHIFAVSTASFLLSEEILPNEANTTDYVCAQALLAPLCRDIFNGCNFQRRCHPQNGCLTAAMEYMEAHFQEDIDLEHVARAIGYHPSTLSKAFPKETGIKFNLYLQYIRCSNAARLIQSREMNLSEIAFSSGFGSIRSFNRAFKAFHGVTPSEYKNEGVV